MKEEHPHQRSPEQDTTVYESMFAERGGGTPLDPLEFHFHHLALYWSRYLGFIRHWPDSPQAWAEGNLGQAIRVVNGFAEIVIDPASPVSEAWRCYKDRTETIFHQRPLTVADVEAAAAAFERCAAAAGHPASPE